MTHEKIKLSYNMKNLVKKLFPDYRGRTTYLNTQDYYSYNPQSTVWSGGYKTEIRIILKENGQIKAQAPNMFKENGKYKAPWDLDSNTQRFPLNNDIMVIELQWAGKSKYINIYATEDRSDFIVGYSSSTKTIAKNRKATIERIFENMYEFTTIMHDSYNQNISDYKITNSLKAIYIKDVLNGNRTLTYDSNSKKYQLHDYTGNWFDFLSKFDLESKSIIGEQKQLTTPQAEPENDLEVLKYELNWKTNTGANLKSIVKDFGSKAEITLPYPMFTVRKNLKAACMGIVLWNKELKKWIVTINTVEKKRMLSNFLRTQGYTKNGKALEKYYG